MRLPSILRLALAILAVPAPAPQALAGDFQVPLRSTPIRVTRAEGSSSPIAGTPLAVLGDTLRIANGRVVTFVARHGIGRFEVGRGTSRSTGKGALIGLVTGGGIGAVIGATSEHDELFSQGFNIAAGAFSLGLLGAGIGAIAGQASKRVRWEALPATAVGVDSAGGLWAPIGANQRLRVTAPWGRVTGLVRDLGPDSLVLARGEGGFAIPTRLIRKVETSWARRSNGTLGALIGLAAGFATGVMATDTDPHASRAAGGLLVGTLGMTVGWLVGVQVKSARWEETPLRPPPLTPLDPGRDASGAGLEPGGR